MLHLEADPEQNNKERWMISLWTRPLADLDIELEHAYEKADLFEKVFKRSIRFHIVE